MVPRKFYGSMLLVGFTLAAGCGGASTKQKENVKIYGTKRSGDFAHPLIDRKVDLKVPGCCSLIIKPATVDILQSDGFAAKIKGNQFTAELSFGFYENVDGEHGGEYTTLHVDGVALKHNSVRQPDNSARHLWIAKIPLNEPARRRGLANPELKIIGTCQSKVSCDRLNSLVSTIRF